MSNVVELRPEFNERAEKLDRKSKRVKLLEKQNADLKTEIARLENELDGKPSEETFSSMQEEIEQAEKELIEMRDNMLYRRRVYSQEEFKEAIEEILSGFNRIS